MNRTLLPIDTILYNKHTVIDCTQCSVRSMSGNIYIIQFLIESTNLI